VDGLTKVGPGRWTYHENRATRHSARQSLVPTG
jgi:hypothetical protein